MCLRCRVPGQLLARAARPRTGLFERARVVEKLSHRVTQGGDVVGRHHTPGTERSHRLGKPADVVDDGGQARSERLQKRAALVELRSIGEDRDRRFAERPLDLRLREIAEPKLSSVEGGQRPHRVAGDEEAASRPPRRLGCVLDLFVGADHPEREHRAAVVAPLRLAGGDGVGDHAELLLRNAEVGEDAAATLAVHDDSLEPGKQPSPESGLRRRPTGEQVVRGEHERRSMAKQAQVDLRQAEPLDVDDVSRHSREPREAERVLECLHGHAERRAPEDPRGDRIEDLTSSVPRGRRHRAEAEARGDELDLGSRATERGRQLVVVERRESGRIGKDDAHARRLVPVLVRSWNLFHGNTKPPDRGSHLHAMIRLASADRPDVLCLQEVPLWALPRLGRWSGMRARWVVTRRPWLPAWLGGVITRLNNGLLRSALAGQANAILLAPGLEPLGHHTLRIDEARREPRWCHAVALDDLVVANLHASNDFRRPELVGAEIIRAERFVSGLAGELPAVLAGDFNLRAESLHELPGWSALGPGIDHVLVRGLSAEPLVVWPEERRRQNGRVLSDHAPVEVRLE